MTIEDFVNCQRSIPIQSTGLSLTQSTKTVQPIYHPNSRANTSLESHTPTNNATTAITIRIVFDVFGATARVMRSAEDTRPDATELNVLVFCDISMWEKKREIRKYIKVERTVSSRTRFWRSASSWMSVVTYRVTTVRLINGGSNS